MRSMRNRSNKRCGRRAGGLLLLIAAVAAAAGLGCQTPAHRVVRGREASLKYALRTIDRSERSRPARFERTSDHIARVTRIDADRSRENPGELAGLIQRDAERWEENQSFWLKRIERHAAGKPERIGENALILFY